MRVGFVVSAFVCLAGSAVAQSSDERVIPGSVTEAAPRSVSEITLEAGQLVTLTTASADGLDTILTLVGPDGQTLAENDDREPGILTSQIIHMATTSGRYMAVVTGYGGATGVY